MQQYIIRRILLNFLVIFLVATLVFLVLRIDTPTSSSLAQPVHARGASTFKTRKPEGKSATRSRERSSA